jgi:hypothetical protein
MLIVIEWCCLCKKSGESIDHLLLHSGSLELHSYFIWGRVGYATIGVGVVE